MRSVSQPFRKALFNRLNAAITYRGVVIPICEEYLNTRAAILKIGNNQQVTAWIQLQNQNSENDSPKCMRNDTASIQLQARVSFNANSGNYEEAENIMDLVLARIFTGPNSFELPIEEGFHISRITKESDRNINFQDNTARIWMKNITLQASISQSLPV
jgi:hypothetical protein